jgi:toxin ParE1/3/4
MGVQTAVKSPEALRDFRRIYAWIASNSGEARAEAVLRRLDEAAGRLARRPRLGRRRMDFKGDPYSFSVPPWLIVYDPLPDGNGIYILRILDNRRNVAALLGKKT